MTKGLPDYLVVDTESDGLLYESTKLHVICCRRSHDAPGEVYVFHDDPSLPRDGTIDDGLALILSHSESGYDIVGHNFVGHDLSLINKLYPNKPRHESKWSPWNFNVKDTLCLVQLLLPDRPHSLDYFGKIFKHPKPVHTDWSKLSAAMIHRCSEDVLINEKLWLRYGKRYYDQISDWEQALDLEQKVAWIHAEQTLHGIRFNLAQAVKLHDHLQHEYDRLTKEIHKELGLRVIPGDEVPAPFKQNGAPLARVINYFGVDCVYNGHINKTQVRGDSDAIKIMGPYSKISFEPPDLESPKQIKEILFKLGWEPTTWNYKKDKRKKDIRDAQGNKIKSTPKITEDSFSSLPAGLGKKVADFLVIRHRKGILRSKKGTGAFVQVRLPDKKDIKIGASNDCIRIPATGMPCNTNTHRYTHSGFVCNLPGADEKTPYGFELRALLTVPPGHKFLGVDLKGIEARMMAHYAMPFDGGAYAKVILREADIHKYNAKILGITKPKAKAFLYAVSYGASAPRVAELLKCTRAEAQKFIDEYWAKNSGLADKRDELENEYKWLDDHIIGLDGRRIFIRGKHMLLNSIIQSSSAVIFKEWMVRVYETMHLNTKQLLAYHDELGYEIPDNKYAMKNMEDVLRQALKHVESKFGISVPLDLDIKIGNNYAEVH